jgi:hypothetical protein
LVARILHVLLLGLWLGTIAGLLAGERPLSEALDSAQSLEAAIGALHARALRFGLWGLPLVMLSFLVGWSSLRVPLQRRFSALACLAAVIVVEAYFLLPRLLDLGAALGERMEGVDTTRGLGLAYADARQYLYLADACMVALTVFLIISAMTQRSSRSRRLGIEV